MKMLAAVFLLGLLCLQQAMAHEGHDHKFITESAAITVGRETAANLSQKDAGLGVGKLPASWATVPAKNATLHKNGDGYYIVAVVNESEKQTLYILMSSLGEIRQANFTGEFANIE